MGYGTVNGSYKYKIDGETVEEDLSDNGRIQEEVEAPNEVLPGRPCIEVSYSEGETAKVQGYEFVRVDVGIKVCVDNNEDAANAGFEFAKEWVKRRRREEVPAILNELRNGGS